MGKGLIIKGADFSLNGIAPEFKEIDWIAASDVAKQATDSNVQSSYYRSVEYLISADASEGAKVTNLGANGQQSAAKCIILLLATGTMQSNFLSQSTNKTNMFSVIADGQVHSLKLSKDGLEVDGDLIPPNNPVSPTEFNPRTNYALDASYLPLSSTTSVGSSIYHIHGVRIYEEKNLIADFIPVKVLADNIPNVPKKTICFYNKVGGTYHVRNGNNFPLSSENYN